MAVGIVSYGAYIPISRLSLAKVSQMWGGQARTGEKAVANCDEDSLTLATEAISDCLTGIDRQSVDSLYLASTTPVYYGKQSASIIAKVVDLRREVLTADITGSVRSGTIAFGSAMDGINAGSATRSLVVASDCRVPAPDSELEMLAGDGSAALLFGNSDIAVEIEGSYTITSDFMDIWKRPEDTYLHTWEDRFLIECGYFDHVKEVVKGLFQRYGVKPGDFARVVLYPYDARRHSELAKQLGFDKSQMQDHLLASIGHTGAASTLMMLVAALEEAKAGDRILLINYGDGGDAFILRITEQIERVRGRRGIKRNLASKIMLPSYGKYVHYRNLMEWGIEYSPQPLASLAMSWRDRNMILGCKGNKCTECSNIMFPPQRVCSWCQTKDKFEEVRLSDKKGTLFTYSKDSSSLVTLDPPSVIAIVDFEGGGRFSTVMTDRDPDKIEVGMPVELTLRRVHEARGIHNYFWKCRPPRA